MYLLVSIIFAYIDCLALWFIQDRLDLIAEKNKLVQQSIDLLAQLKSQEKDATTILLERCAIAGINERNTKIAVMYYIERKTPKQIWKWLCENNENMEIDSVYILLNRINKKINKNDKDLLR